MANRLAIPENWHRVTAEESASAAAGLSEEERARLIAYERVSFNRPEILSALQGPAPAPAADTRPA